MSRIGKQPIEVPKNVMVTFNDSIIQVKGPTGELSHKISDLLKITYLDNIIKIEKYSPPLSVTHY
jgi:large subunit ribosomal protein L6